MKTMLKKQLLQRLALIAAALVLTMGPGRALAQRPVGIDVSSYQGTPNWGSIKSCGWTFAWAKATEGVS
ncbi:MAG TPA: glycoside hydrolase family 25, partial [Verrucomicrobiae bacterium]|nr:glycoside hydrolase family 25 [Verrucomicrobiae bacterium]